MKPLRIVLSVLLVISATLVQFSCGGENGSITDQSTAAATTAAEDEKPVPEELLYDPAVPKAKYQATTVYYLDMPASFSDKLTAATLQGLVANLSDEQILLRAGAYLNYEKYMKNEWGVKTAVKVDKKATSVAALLTHYKDLLKGYILCSKDENSESGSVAISLSGVLGGVVVTPENKDICEKLGLECLIDVSGKDDKWLRSSEYWDKLNKDIAFEQPLNMAPKLVDYAAMCGAYFSFYNGHNAREHTTKYSFLNAGGIVFGYNNTLGEYETVASFSSKNIQMVPSDHACNLSTLSGFVRNTMTQKTAKTEAEAGKKVHTVCLVMSDGDNVQWLMGDFTNGTKWFGNGNRGKFDMGWGLPATTIDLVAPMNSYLYDKMTEKDEFIMQLGGLGYTFPSKWSSTARKNMAAKLAEYMKRTDLHYAEILDDNGFSANAISAFTEQDGIDGLFYIEYSNYAGKRGQIIWTNDKPAVAARYRLWANTSDGTIDAISKAVNRASTDPTKAASYSFIIVHAWSGLSGGSALAEGGITMDAVAKLVDSFGDSVEVVTPTEFMNRIVANHAQ